ncbi:DgyrCDS8628 [Dimorphilus gyrociliatus]|uniref:DgyrCDS8628 n=1 Tax=Dimorphilus gyrociliatus TaxID=2664684 RepID=A0A7I8VWE5_9ANNE|nr:DgyrCDS8628 [Dimorphilus gyrociliatus]
MRRALMELKKCLTTSDRGQQCVAVDILLTDCRHVQYDETDGNGCIIAISTIRLQSQWSVQDCINRFVALLSFSDGGLSIPTYFASLVTGKWPFMDVICQIYGTLHHVFATSMVLLLVMGCCERLDLIARIRSLSLFLKTNATNVDIDDVVKISKQLRNQYELTIRKPITSQPIIEMALPLRLRNKERLECFLEEYEGRLLTAFVNDVFTANTTFEANKSSQNLIDVLLDDKQIQDYRDLLIWQCRYYKRNHLLAFLSKALSFMADSSLPLAYVVSVIINPKRSYQEANRRNFREDEIKCCDDEDEPYQSQITRV